MKKKSSRLPHALRAWTIWLLSAFFVCYKFALEVSPSIMTTTLMRTFEIDATTLGNLTASYFYAYLLMQIPAGLLLDRFGPRRITTAAIFLCACGCFIFAKAPNLTVALMGRFLTGIGAAFAVVNCMKLIANWFPSKLFAFMAGLMMTVGMLGAVVGQAPLGSFVEALSWRYAIQTIGLAGIGLALLFWLIVRDKAPEHRQDKALHPNPEKMPVFVCLRRIFSNPQAWWLSAYSGFAFAPVMVFAGLWGVPFLAESFHISHNIAAQSISLIFVGFAVGAPVFGWFSDWIKTRRLVMFWGTLLAMLSISCIVYAPGLSYSFLSFLLFFFGFSISSFLLCFTMIREINAPILAATAIGFMNAFDAFFGAFSDPLAGKILDMGWSGELLDGARVFSVSAYKMALITLPAYLIISLGLLSRIKETHCKEIVPNTLP